MTSIPSFTKSTISLGCLLGSLLAAVADEPTDFAAAAAKRRAEIRVGGDFRPDPQVPTFVAVGHGGRILLSRDDGQTWRQAFWGHPGSDHGLWATKAVAYTQGVFVVPLGWGAATAWLASEDGENWRHLTDGQTRLTGIKEAQGDPRVMPGTWSMAAGQGVFVSGGYMTMAATADFGKSITTFSLREFNADPRPRKLVTHHVEPIYCGDRFGRFLALGNDRTPQQPMFGNLFASDDLGRTWRWLEPQLLNDQCDGYSGIASNGQQVVIADRTAAHVFVSSDAGNSWQGPIATGLQRATLSVVGKEFWLVSSQSARASSDGQVWRELPAEMPTGKIMAAPTGTLVCIDRRRTNILRSSDGGVSWQQVYAFAPETEHVHGAQGLRDIAFGYSSQP